MKKAPITGLLSSSINPATVFASPLYGEEDKREGLEFIQPHIEKDAMEAATKEANSIASKWRMKIKPARKMKAIDGLIKDKYPQHLLRIAKERTGLPVAELVKLAN